MKEGNPEKNLSSADRRISGRRARAMFVAFFLLAGLCNLLMRDRNRMVETLFFSLNLVLLFGLLFFWRDSVKIRLLPSAARTYILCCADLMLFFILLRGFKYRFTAVSALLARCIDYLYYIPMIFIPTLFLMTALFIRDERQEKRRMEQLHLLPAVFFSLCFLSNDLHHLVYRPLSAEEPFFVGRSAYGILLYAAYVWILLCIFGGIWILLKKAKSLTGKQRFSIFIGPICWLLASSVAMLLQRYKLPRAYSWAEINAFSLLAIYESCLMLRLIPNNESYRDYFCAITLPVRITDRDYSPMLSTAAAWDFTDEQMASSLKEAVYPDPDTRLTGLAITGGYGFFAEDETQLHEIQDRLREAGEILSMENEVLEREKELAAEKLEMEERNQLYERIGEAVYPAQKKIEELLGRAKSGSEEFRSLIAETLLLNAYVKRRANLCILQQQSSQLSAFELGSALKESVYYLRYNGMDASFSRETQKEISCDLAILLYDAFEAVIEKLQGKATEVWVCLREGGLLLLAEMKEETKGREEPRWENLPADAFDGLDLSCSSEDGQLTLRLRYRDSASNLQKKEEG